MKCTSCGEEMTTGGCGNWKCPTRMTVRVSTPITDNSGIDDLRTRLAAAERERDEALALVKIYQGEREMCPHCRELRQLRARIAALEETITER